MRVKINRRERHNKLLALAKGFRMTKNRLYKVASEAVLHAGQYAFNGRKLKKRDLRRTWIVRINSALKTFGVSYSKFIDGLKKNKIEVDRKIMGDLVVRQPKAFEAIVKKAGFSFTEK